MTKNKKLTRQLSLFPEEEIRTFYINRDDLPEFSTLRQLMELNGVVRTEYEYEAESLRQVSARRNYMDKKSSPINK